jgi:long-chain acyl-CoA synthetase
VFAYSNALSAGPVFATHPLDLQSFPPSEFDAYNAVAPTGPPSANTEVKLVGVVDDIVEAGGDPDGELLIRGPAVGTPLGLDDELDNTDGWRKTGVKAKVASNGSFRVADI